MISKLKTYLFLLLAAISLTAGAQVQDTIVSFVNFYPGSDIYELEGHSVLRIEIPSGDYAVSYGTYNFEQPNFVYRFVKGETDYWVTVAPWSYFERAYRNAGRRIVEHKINLNSAQKENLLQLVAENLQPENRTYRYNYVKDNCATRPLGILEKAIGDSIILGEVPEAVAGDKSFRDIMRYYHRNYPWYQFGIDLALGCGIDYNLSNREKAFAPVVLDRQLEGATVNDQPLVERTIIVNDVADDNAVLSPTPWFAGPMTVALLVMIAAIALTFRDILRRKETKWFDAVMYGVYGLAGLLLTFLVFVSVHEATSPNILLLWLNPLCFIPVVFIWINKLKIVLFSYQIVNFVSLIALAILWIAGVQALNLAFIPLVIADAVRAASYIYLNINTVRCRG